VFRVYFASETAQVELKVDECKPLPYSCSLRPRYCRHALDCVTTMEASAPSVRYGRLISGFLTFSAPAGYSLADAARLVIGCHITQRTRVLIACQGPMTWRAMGRKP